MTQSHFKWYTGCTEKANSYPFILIDRFTNATVAADMVISAAPMGQLNSQPPESGYGLPEVNRSLAKRISLSQASISGTGAGVVDLTREDGACVFEATADFLEYLGKGNRALFRLRDIGQLQAVAVLAYEQTLSFEFDRTAEEVSLLVFRRGTRSVGGETIDGGTGI